MPDPFIGEIRMFAGTFAPRGWALCDGSILSVNSEPTLFAVLGTTYGGNGITTFGLPDLRGRVPFGVGQVPGGIYKTQGQVSGNDLTSLTQSNMPPHHHTMTNATVTQNLTATGTGSIKCHNSSGNSKNPGGKYLAGTDSREGDQIYSDSTDSTTHSDAVQFNVSLEGDIAVSGNTDNSGSGHQFSNLPPFGVVNYIIAIDGTFPPRT